MRLKFISIYAVACPYCESPAGHACWQRSTLLRHGEVKWAPPHWDRIKAAEAAIKEKAMLFGKIDAKAQTIEAISATNINDAKYMCGLLPNETDHGTLYNKPGLGGTGFIVDQFSFYKPKEEQHYFAIGQRLIAGNTLLYQFDERGEDVDFENPQSIVITWFKDYKEVEAAIAAGTVIRPELRINNELRWRWPDPMPGSVFGRK